MAINMDAFPIIYLFLVWWRHAVQMISDFFAAHVPGLCESLLALCRFVLEKFFPPTDHHIVAGPAAADGPAAGGGPAPGPALAAAAAAAGGAGPAAAAAAAGANLNREHLFLQAHPGAQDSSTTMFGGLVALADYNRALGQLLHESLQDQGVQIGELVLQGEEQAQQIQETREGLHGVNSRVVCLEREGRDRDGQITKFTCAIFIVLVALFMMK